MVTPIELFSDLLQANNIFLLILLIIVFIVGYKVLQTVVQLLIISATSGAFLAAISYIGMGPEINVSNIFAFMIIGVSLYVVFTSIQFVSSLLESVWKLIKKVLPSGSKKEKSSGSNSGNQKKVILTEVEDDE